MEQTKRPLKFLPIATDDVPRYDDENGKILIPEDDFLLYKGVHDKTMILLNCWMDNRENAEAELRQIADELDRWEHGCNISSVVGGVAGIGGGAAVMGGVVLMPPVAVAGLVVGGVAALSNMTTGVLKMRNVKKNVAIAKEMLEYDKKLTDTLSSSMTTLEETKEKILSTHQLQVTKETEAVTRETVMSSGRIGAVSLAVGAVRLALKESASLSSTVAKGAVHALTAVGIAIDLLTVTLNVKDMMNGSRSEVAGKLREAADELQSTREEITRRFFVDYLL
ncbi:hypothetical protein Q1695_012420 [Nippostrongylus brasiliensis]|nr:hypothetical protein Q1695_012420 [Nippostrongylus brasiliensis]